MSSREAKRARKVRLAYLLGKPLIELLGRTWRLEETNAEGWRALTAAGKPYLLSVWHGQMLPAIWANRFRGIAAIASVHGDAEIAARMMAHWGYTFVRGSSSQGGREALVQMVEHMTAGRTFAITPDGPRGPRGVPKPGVLVAAVRSGVPIVTLRAAISRSWRTKGWDRFAVPKPFARIVMTYSDPWLPPDTSEASMARLVELMGPAEADELGGSR